jgi:hypothetical protein
MAHDVFRRWLAGLMAVSVVAVYVLTAGPGAG